MGSRRFVLVVVLFVLAAILRPGSTGRTSAASRDAPTCWLGFAATIVGTPGDDVIVGTPRDDVIVGLGGDDTIRGGGGNDVLCGNGGDDVLVSGPGDSGLVGGAGSDLLEAGTGFADLLPGPGDDRVVGRRDAPNWVHYSDARASIYLNLAKGVERGEGRDTLIQVHGGQTGPFDDRLIGSKRGDGLKGAAGNDVIDGRGGGDFLAGQGGDDVIRGGPGFDIADYFDGNYDDGLSTAGPITVDLTTGVATGDGTDTLTDIEGATGSTGSDTMIGDEADNAFFQLWEGGDTIRAGGGDDFIAAGWGADTIDGGAGTDLLSLYDGGLDDPRVTGVTVDLGAGTDSDGDAIDGIEQVVGTSFDDTLSGGGGADALFAIEGDDVIRGGDGNDVIDPGEGADAVDGGAGTDLLANQDHWSGGVQIDLTAGSDSDGDTLANLEDVVGSASSDQIVGSDGPNQLFGAQGDDVLEGSGGDDTIVGDAGNDVANGGDGTDRCEAERLHGCEFGWYRSPVRLPRVGRWPRPPGMGEWTSGALPRAVSLPRRGE